jgi:hypothetical protein
MFTDEAEEFGFVKIEQGPDEGDGGVGGRGGTELHAGNAFAAGATEEAQKEKLHLVVAMMGEGDDGEVMLGGGAGEEFVAQLAGGHFEGDFRAGGDGFDIGSAGKERQTECRGSAADEGFIGIAGAAAQAVVEVGDSQPPAVRWSDEMQGVEQRHGIRAAGDGDEDFLAAGQETSPAGGKFEPLKEVAHAGMVGVFGAAGNLYVR